MKLLQTSPKIKSYQQSQTFTVSALRKLYLTTRPSLGNLGNSKAIVIYSPQVFYEKEQLLCISISNWLLSRFMSVFILGPAKYYFEFARP